jgi:hypothetical protein
VTSRELGRLGLGALLASPGLLLAELAWRAGGYFPGPIAELTLAALGILLARALLTGQPRPGPSPGLLAAVAVVGLLCAWTLASSLWSHAPARADIEADRVLLYAVTLALFGLVGRSPRRARMLVAGLAGGAGAVALAALVVWLAPDHVHVDLRFNRERLAWPIGYWNATGLLAGMGLIWSLQVAAERHLDARWRAAAAGSVPLLGATLVFTASRGALAATLLGLLVLALVGRTRAVVAPVLAAGPAAAIAMIAAAQLEGINGPTWTGEALGSAHRVLVIIVLCAIAAAWLRLRLEALDARLAAVRLPVPPRGASVALVLVAVIGCGAAFMAAHGPERVQQAYHRFADSSVPIGLTPTQRLSRISNNGRIKLWRVALRSGFDPAPLTGSGAGTFPLLWQRHRVDLSDALDAHSLYIQTLAELGIVGLVLVAATLVAVGLALVCRARGPDRGPWAALLGAAVAWAVHAAVDWDWQLPAVTLWLFAAAGLALARPAAGAVVPRPHRARRIGWVAVIAALAIVPMSIARSQGPTERATAALFRPDCTAGPAAAQAAIDRFPVRVQPHELLAYCDALNGPHAAATTEAAEAVRLDPRSWEPWFYLALAQAAAGVESRPALSQAYARNPVSRLANAAVAALGSPDPARRAAAVPGSILPRPVEICGPVQLLARSPCDDRQK